MQTLLKQNLLWNSEMTSLVASQKHSESVYVAGSDFIRNPGDIG